ncbi:hypothetical protein ONZ43_g2107 [Nemania bipapillata]|uniref:Uncharacterized protein n=1 Tax=Nemania bipapillata TaxID=110536 RepID=A0ACC2J1U5_9PEZI|nr:hypothetical protein ONZ43_g2107 [Nemania bipapillata]
MQLQSAFLFLSALAVTTASPLGRRCDSTGVTYVLPSTGGPTSLPAPDLPLQHILVGHGVQNYTCATTGVAGTSVGALAVLYDVTSLYPGSGPGSLSSAKWSALTSKVLHTTSLPIQTASPASPFPPPANLSVTGISKPLPFIGHHFFDLNGVPTFSLNDDAELFKGMKVLNIPAPADADQGLSGEGAVDWLYLSDKGGSVGHL